MLKNLLSIAAQYILSKDCDDEFEKKMEEDKRKVDEKIGYQKSEFYQIMRYATSILEINSREARLKRINDLIITLGKSHQMDIINNLIKGNKNDLNDRKIEKLFLKDYNYKIYSFNQRINNENNLHGINNRESNHSKENSNRTLHPRNSLIFTFPWNDDRLIEAFCNIGKNVGEPWENDDNNHEMTIILPLNIGVVTSGLHSSTINIICNESPIKVTYYLDLAPIYNDIYTDGYFFYFLKNKSVISEVSSVEFAAIFEIGRLINNMAEDN